MEEKNKTPKKRLELTDNAKRIERLKRGNEKKRNCIKTQECHSKIKPSLY
jgi:hypothetical protein